MKASGITKCVKKKWNGSVERKTLTPNMPRSSNSVIQADKSMHFVVNENGLDYSTAIPTEKSIVLSRRTYSKKNPIVYPLSQERTGSFRRDISMKSKPRLSLPPSVDKSLQRKRRRELDLESSKDSTPKKVQKRNLPTKVKNTPQSCPPKLSKQLGSKSSPLICDSSSDSDIEIVAVKVFKPVTLDPKTLTSYKKFSLAQSSLTNKKKSKYFESEVSMNEVLINEADIAPSMPHTPDTFPDARGASNSMRWLSANGTISLPSFSPRSTTENGGTQMKSTDQQSTSSSEIKTSQEKVSKGKRELKNLYENLDEIAWTHERSFKNLLRDPEYIRHSERCKGKMPGNKNLRKLKTSVENKMQTKQVKRGSAVNTLAKKKSKMARLNQKFKAKSLARSRTPSTMKNVTTKLVARQTTLTGNKQKVNVKAKTVSSKKGLEEETDVFYMLNPAAPKPKPALPKGKVGLPKAKASVCKTKPDKPKVKTDVVLKIKTEPPKSNTMKLKPDVLKSKSNVFKLKPEGLKSKPDVTQLKSYVSILKKRDSPPSTSGSQNIACSSKSLPSIPHSKYFGKSQDRQSLLNNRYRFPNEMHMLQGYLEQNNDVYSAFQKGTKLRVRLQPLEHTKLWTDEFYEEFRKHILDQALLRAYQSRGDSANVMYQELLESLMTAQPAPTNGNNSSSNNRVMKKKKVEEEALRSSVRQSEGAFRYREIVVKKHPNYLQVVLVPNEMKQNSLTLEAIKELRDAFLLAKKDPNCRAVLLNSSGPYFCSGIDLRPLVGNNKKQAAEDLSNSIKDLVMTLGMFTKPVIAAVNGATVGFGVSILTFCDVVLASDKATFYLPATKIGYMPEGGITLTLPQVVGSSVASEMFLQGRRLTAEQACRYGLVSEVIWPTKLMNEVIPRLQTIISQPLQAMEATKTMVRCNLWDKLRTHVDRERRLICEHWLSAQCQSNIKSLLQTGWLYD